MTTAWVAFPREAVKWTVPGGSPSVYRASSFSSRAFCPACGRSLGAIDDKPVHFFFLIVAPPLEVSNQYLPVLGKIAQFSKESDVPQRLLGLTEPVQFLDLLKEKGV